MCMTTIRKGGDETDPDFAPGASPGIRWDQNCKKNRRLVPQKFSLSFLSTVDMQRTVFCLV